MGSSAGDFWRRGDAAAAFRRIVTPAARRRVGLEWGRIDEIGFPSNRSFVNYAGLDASDRYAYTMGSVEDFVTRQVTGESQWAVQVTLRYAF